MRINFFKLALATIGLTAFGLAGPAGAQLVPNQCQKTTPTSNFRGLFGGSASCSSIPGTTCCEIQSFPGFCEATDTNGKTLKVTAENIPVGDPDDPPGVKFEVDQQLGEEFAIRRVDQFMVEGATKGSNCVWSYAEDIVTAAGGIFVKNNGQISNPNSAFFFADADEDLPPRSLSKFIPNCRDVTVIGENEDGFGGLTIDPATACEGTTHTPGVSQVLVNVLEIRNSAGDRVPFFGQQIGNTIEGNIDTSNFCVCNHLAEQPDEGLDGRDFACDEFTEPGELNPESGEFGCAIETGVNSRVPGGLISVNPTCSRWGTNRCY